MLRRTFAATALATLLASTAVPVALAEEIKMPRVISISGHGEVKVVPDMAVVIAGVLSQAATAGESLTANTSAMNAIFAALKAAGIEAKDIQTSNFMVQPRYDYNNNNGEPPKLVGYDVSNTVTVNVRKLEQLGTLLDTLVKAGSNQINGVSFQVSKSEAALDEARKLAAADATRKANLYVTTMGLSLGPVMSIAEGVSYQPPVPMRAKAMAAEAMPSPVPMAAGEQTLSMDVNVTWEIR